MKGPEWITLIAASAAALLIGQSPAIGQTQNCAGRDTVLTRLSETYGETRQSIAMAQNNQVVEVFASSETGTWTITVTMPNGLTCLVASGEAYERVAAIAADEKPDA